MEDVTEELARSEMAVARLAAKAPGRWLRFEHLNRNGTGFEERDYYQSELGLMPMQAFFNQIKREIKNVMDGEYGTSLGELFAGESGVDAPRLEGATAEDVNRFVGENANLIRAVLDLIERVPDFELDVIVLALGVHDRDRDWVKEALAQPPYRGGLTRSEGVDIIRQFIRDNASAVRRFFTEDLPSLFEEVKDALDLGQGQAQAETDEPSGLSTGGRPSSTTSPDTPVSASTT